MLRGFILLMALVPSFYVTAQYTDTTTRLMRVQDTLLTPQVNTRPTAVMKPFPYKAFLLPVTFVVYGIVSLHTDALQDVNETVKEKVYTERLPHKLPIDNYLQYAPTVAIYGLNAAGIHGINNFRDRTMLLGIANLLMGITVNVTKNITGETRPDGSDNRSFPSGHTATAFAAAECMRQEYKDRSPLYGIAGYSAAVVTGYFRISNNKHWMSDVVAGAGVGIASAKLAYWMYPAIKRKLFKNKVVKTVVMPTYGNGVWGFGMVHCFQAG